MSFQNTAITARSAHCNSTGGGPGSSYAETNRPQRHHDAQKSNYRREAIGMRTVLHSIHSVGVCAGLLFLPATISAQDSQRPAAALVRELTDMTPTPTEGLATVEYASCEALDDLAASQREVAAKLIALGSAAVPDIEAALSSVRNGTAPASSLSGVDWLLIAYASIRGMAAIDPLQSLVGHPNFTHFAGSIDVAISIAMGITSYVDSTVPRALVVCGSQDPRDALNHMIAAWQRGDRASFESGRGVHNKFSEMTLDGLGTWQELRSRFWHHAGGIAAMGYRFLSAGPWSEPQTRVTEERSSGPPAKSPDGPTLVTEFVKADGGRCGQLGLTSMVSPALAAGS